MSPIDDAFAAFDPAQVEDAQRSSLQQRLTLKFLLPAGALPGLAQVLGPHYSVLFSAGRPSAGYRTLHFDTADLAFFHAHRRGRRRRQKVRIRHYDDRRLSFFEIKDRIHELKSVKLRRPREFGDDDLHPDDLALARIHAHVRGRLLPQVWTLFQRLTLINRTADERVTLDFGLRFGDGCRETALPHVAVAEVKQLRLDRGTPVMVALRHRGFRPRSFSKYCAAVVTTHPGIRHQRLLPQLRALEAIEHGT